MALNERQLSEALADLGFAAGYTDGRSDDSDLHKDALIGVIGHIRELEGLLTWADGEVECFGTEGWRHRLGID